MSKRSDKALSDIDSVLKEFDPSYTPPEKCESTNCDGCKAPCR